MLLALLLWLLFHRRGSKVLVAAAARKPVLVVRGQRKPDWVTDRVIRIKALSPHLGCRMIAATFNRQCESRESVSKSWVATCLRNNAYRIAEERRKIRARTYRPGKRNRVWGVDLASVTDERNERHTVFGAIDYGTRRALALKRVSSKHSMRLLLHMAWPVFRFGRPRFIRTDNEAVFAARRFRWGLALLGVRQQTSDVHCPWQNGRIERLFGTLKPLLKQVAISDAGTLDWLLADFVSHYNELRPHSSLGYATPNEIWFGRGRWVSHWDGLLWGWRCR